MQNPRKTSEPEQNKAEELERSLTHRYQSPQPCTAAHMIACKAVRKESGLSKSSEAQTGNSLASFENRGKKQVEYITFRAKRGTRHI